MFARSTTVHGDIEWLDAGIQYVEEHVMPVTTEIHGCIGLSMLVSDDSGSCITTSAWRSGEAMRAGEQQLRLPRDRMAEILGGDCQVDEWEIAVLRRDHLAGEGACVRCTWFAVPTGRFDRGIDVYRMGLLPEIEDMDGFGSASLFTDRSAGVAVSSVTFDSRAAMARTRGQADSLRGEAAQQAGLDVLDVDEFDLVLAHLRVPELV